MSEKYHEFWCRVYYEDTDLGGIVYYANYLKFIERARSEWLRELGIDQNLLKAQNRNILVVRKIEANYLMPAKYDDVLIIKTGVKKMTGASIVLNQDIYCVDKVIFKSFVTIVCVKIGGKVLRLPADIRRLLSDKKKNISI